MKKDLAYLENETPIVEVQAEKNEMLNEESGVESVVKSVVQIEIKKIEPIKEISMISAIANPLQGLSKRIQLDEIPSQNQVGISAYPDAVVIQIDKHTEYKGKLYVSMELTTTDSVEQVLKYYKNEEAKWTHIQKNGIHTFKKDADKYFRETNTLQILPINKILYEEVDSLLGYEANTLIRIYYEIAPVVLNNNDSEELAYATPINN